ncbi:unnamed protein product, partial [Ectocarpus sp. 8 AP-2014]
MQPGCCWRRFLPVASSACSSSSSCCSFSLCSPPCRCCYVGWVSLLPTLAVMVGATLPLWWLRSLSCCSLGASLLANQDHPDGVYQASPLYGWDRTATASDLPTTTSERARHRDTTRALQC